MRLIGYDRLGYGSLDSTAWPHRCRLCSPGHVLALWSASAGGTETKEGRDLPGVRTVGQPLEIVRVAAAPVPFGGQDEQVSPVRQAPSVRANGARPPGSSTRCRISPPSATRTNENSVDTQTAPSASRQMPSGATPSANTSRLDRPPSGLMLKVVSRPVKSQAI